ncbi:helix-turn-helix domain-containing protein [Faucicola atlantae]|uniref:Transcriptional regulator n=1 Tax=Faucicola atlantae TaxID=34059 RepID=A0A1B8QKZ6_9GAMM|nr:helix-turn-helix transcriptional regulator [Moraxella atlantae]OBX84250.1 transcriptional regulator [Moraxella atlantae]
MIKINLPVLLAQRGIKVADLDREIDISRSTLYRLYNNDVIKIDIDAIDKLCQFLNCTPGDIILYEEDGQKDIDKKKQTD